MPSTNEIRATYFIHGGYLVVWSDGTADAICAYEGADDAAEEAADYEGVPLHAYHMVCGWDAADRMLAGWGGDPEAPMFVA